MKRIISIILVICMLSLLSACAGEYGVAIIEDAKNENTAEQGQNQVQNQVTQSGQQNQTGSGGETNNNQTSEKTPTVETKPNNPTVMGVFYRNVIGADIFSDDLQVKEIDKKANAMLKKIEDYPDTLKASNGGNTYYLSNNGDDKANGLTPQTAKKTYAAIKLMLKEGDVVLFRRGDIFRGQIFTISGVSFGAYGSGIKPRIYGSADGTKGEWVETSTKGVYTYDIPTAYANIIFNNGEAVGRPVQKLSDITKKPLSVFYNGRVNIYSPNGNPKDIFDSIEIVADYTLIRPTNDKTYNVTLQNLCLMYTGVHCLTTGDAYNLTIEGCIMGYCGGRDLYMGDKATSLGNCVEIWAFGENVNIHDNYFFQAFDTGITHQGPTDSKNFEGANYTNIHYENNLIEYCTYGIEAFSLRSREKQAQKPNATWNYNDVYIVGNIIRYTGYGWGSLDRPDKSVYSDIVYDAYGEDGSVLHVKPLTIENNVFDRSRKRVINIATPEFNKANMILKNNQFVLAKNVIVCMNGYESFSVKQDYVSAFEKYYGTYSGNTFKVLN